MAEKKRRGHHEGSVYYVASRDRWIAEISIGPGKRKKFYYKTKQEAIKKKNEALRELERGELATGPRRKLGDYLEDWIENVHKDNIRVSTYVKYKKLIKYIVADLGEVWLQKLTPEQVQRFYAKKRKDGLSSKTVHEIHGVLHLALKHAVRWNYISRNICDLLDSPRVVTRKGMPLTLEQAKRLLESIRGHRLEVVLMMAVVTGMRRGEILALRWSDVDLDRRVLRVLHTVDYIPKYGYVEGEPKTQAGKRTINLPEFFVDMLEQHRVKQSEQRHRAGGVWENRDLVFPDLTGGYLNPGYVLRMFKRILERAGLPHMHFHDLRHSAATILISMGINPKVIQELLGHSDISITLGVYGHLFPSMQQDVVDKWQDVFGDKGEGDEDDNDGSGGVLSRQ
jgi:integrase